MEVNPKDYVCASGCYGAVVSHHIEDGRVLVTVRYITNDSGEVKKYSYAQATEWLKQYKTDYIFHSNELDVNIHAIPIDEIDTLYKPIETIQRLASLSSNDHKQTTAIEVVELLLSSGVTKTSIGITGSLMLGFHNQGSDIDVVVYDRDAFHQIRYLLIDKMSDRQEFMLSNEMWQESYARRDCEISFDDYVFHEQRKYNKFCINNTKVDISLVLLEEDRIIEAGPFNKKDRVTIQAEIIDDIHAFDSPARYYIDNANVPEIICHTATYIGQAFIGETVEAVGVIELDQDGNQRLIIGTSREASGEYIKVVS